MRRFAPRQMSMCVKCREVCSEVSRLVGTIITRRWAFSYERGKRLLVAPRLNFIFVPDCAGREQSWTGNGNRRHSSFWIVSAALSFVSSCGRMEGHA